MAHRIYVGTKPDFRDAAGEKIRARIGNDLGITAISRIRAVTVYALDEAIPETELTAVAEGPLSDPVIQDYTIDSTFCGQFDWLVEVGFLPGVTDNVGRTAREACAITLRRKPGDAFPVHTATQYLIRGTLSRGEVRNIAESLLANMLVNRVNIYSRDEWMNVHNQQFPVPAVTATDDRIVLFREVDLSGGDDRLLEISAKGMLALSLDEMKAIRAHYGSESVCQWRRDAGLSAHPTNVELEILAQTWSEHCKHKIFNAHIEYHEEGKPVEKIEGLFREYIRRATGQVRAARGSGDICLSVFTDNAGVIRFNDTAAIVFKVETHNSPSALDPYGGALTGIVGVNRDPFGTGMGSRLIANTDVFCFASPFYAGTVPPRILHPKRVFEGVREGVEHGGNKSGIPTVNGSIVFDDRFLGKPLVYCGTLGIMDVRIHGKNGYEKKAACGDHVIMVGGRIGKDGIHGATFSSEPLHEGSPVTAVQIGDPITQKRMTDFLIKALEKNLYNSITDNGAGGLSSSVGEMAQDTGGATVRLDRAPLKYHGLEPWEIIISEAQERMTVAVPPEKTGEFLALAAEWNVEATDLGEFDDSGYFTLMYGDTVVGCLSMAFLHDGLPPMNLTARWSAVQVTERPVRPARDFSADLLLLLRRLNICSKEYVVRQYDHEVQGGSVIKPLCGARNDGPSDAAVFRPLLDSCEGVVVSNGIVPRYSDIDTRAMAGCALDEAVRNAVCAGADPDHMAALDNFCWCDPVKSAENPDGEFKLGQLVRANKALYEICVEYGIALISGKDSMKNDYRIGTTRISIPPTLLVSVVAKIHDVAAAQTMDLKKAGNSLYILGTTFPDLGASEYALMKNAVYGAVPEIRESRAAIESYRRLHEAIRAGHVRACHDLSDGGLAVALAEMCFSGELGAVIDLALLPQSGCDDDMALLFSESPCRILVEVAGENERRIERMFYGFPFARIGTVVPGDTVEIRGRDGAAVVSTAWSGCKNAWKEPLNF